MNQTFAIIKDTFRECLAKKILVAYFLISTATILAIMFIFSFDIANGEVALSVLFFNDTSIQSLDSFEEGIIKAEAIFSMLIFTGGLFLSLFSTADILPGMMAKGRLDLYLARPISRAKLLVAKFIGVVTVVSVNVIYAIVGIWLVIGIKAGIWNSAFLMSCFSIILMFTVLYTFMILIGIFIRSTSMMLILAFVLISMSSILAQREEFFYIINNKFWETIIEGLYWIVPKYYEMSLITKDLVEGYGIISWTPIISNLLIGVVVINLSIYLFTRRNC